MTATVQDGSNTVLDTDYYRYYTSNSSTGYVHGLKYSFSGHSYDRLFAALGSGYSTASDSQVAPFADHYFEYDSVQRVTKEVAAGTGTDLNNGTGTSAITYSYQMMSNNPVDYNKWKYVTTETFYDGSTQTVYANGYGETMLTVFVDTRTGITYLTFHKYDGDGRLILTAIPSAVTGYSQQYADLLNNGSGSNYQYISSNSGLLWIHRLLHEHDGRRDLARRGRRLRRGHGGPARRHRQQNPRSMPDAILSPTPPAAPRSTRGHHTVYRNSGGTWAADHQLRLYLVQRHHADAVGDRHPAR